MRNIIQKSSDAINILLLFCRRLNVFFAFKTNKLYNSL